MKKQNGKFSEYDTLMIYLDECQDQELINEILSSQEGCKQLENVKRDMQIIEENINYLILDEDYGSNLWNKISDKLQLTPNQRNNNWFRHFYLKLIQPRFFFTWFFSWYGCNIYYCQHFLFTREKSNTDPLQSKSTGAKHAITFNSSRCFSYSN